LVSSVIVVSGCSELGIGTVCTEELRAGLTVTPRDAITGQPVLIKGTVVAREGAFIDSATNAPPSQPSFSLVYERAGTYTVTMDMPGYQPWRIDGVAVGRDECHVITVPLAAQISRIGQARGAT
jgi:hypothetical protein